MKKILLKINDTIKSKSTNSFQFYTRNPYKNEGHKKPLHFYEIKNPFKINDTKKSISNNPLQFYLRNPL